jgi:hypothetical protein
MQALVDFFAGVTRARRAPSLTAFTFKGDRPSVGSIYVVLCTWKDGIALHAYLVTEALHFTPCKHVILRTQYCYVYSVFVQY